MKRCCLKRDRGVCQMCITSYRDDLSSLQVHHIYPSSLYPLRRASIANGITLCTKCHIGIVHARNTFRDIATVHNWRRFVSMFRRITMLAENKRFTAKWQRYVNGERDGD